MPIKRRQKDDNAITCYHDYRAYWWGVIDHTGFNSHGSEFVVNGERWPLKPAETVLVPKLILFFKDVWHCGSREKAQQVLHDIALFPDIRYIELKGKWLWVEWDHHGKDHFLPGQKREERKSYRT